MWNKAQGAINGFPATLTKVIENYTTKGRLEVADLIKIGMKCTNTDSQIPCTVSFSTSQQAITIIKPPLNMASASYHEILSFVNSAARDSSESFFTAFSELTKSMISLRALLDVKVAEETVSPITHMVTGASALYVGQEVVSCLDYYFAGVDIDFSNHTSGN